MFRDIEAYSVVLQMITQRKADELTPKSHLWDVHLSNILMLEKKMFYGPRVCCYTR